MFDYFSNSTAPYPEECPFDQDAEESARALREIGDQLAEHVHRVEEAMRDFDAELTASCVRALREDAWTLARESVVAYLGLAALFDMDPRIDPGCGCHALAPMPAPLDAASWPPVPRKGARKGVRALLARTESCRDELNRLDTWISDAVAVAAEWYDDEDPVHTAAVVVTNIGRVVERVEEIVELWQEFVIGPHPALAASQRGLHPPRFVAFEAELDAMMARFRSAQPRDPAA